MSLWLRVLYYLLHFERPYKGPMQHYIGFTQCDLDSRLENHRQGRASAITKAAIAECSRLSKLPGLEDLRLATWALMTTCSSLPGGGPIHPDTVSSLMNTLINAHNDEQAEQPDEELPHARLHDLRHIHASRCVSKKAPSTTGRAL